MTELTAKKLAAKERKRTRVEAELKRMKIGFCGVKHDCLVWRVSKTRWQVGQRSVSLKHEAMTVGAAAIFICG